MLKPRRWLLTIGLLVFILSILTMSASASYVYRDCSKSYNDVPISGEFQGRDYNVYWFNCQATFNKGGIFSADSASSYLYFDNSSSVTINLVSTEMVFQNGQTRKTSSIPLASVSGIYGQKTINVYHNYVFTGLIRNEEQVIGRL